MSESKISFYIPAYNAEKTIVTCIKSILNQSIKPDEIVVIDDGSQDNTKNLIKINFPNTKLIENKNNMGLGYSRNLAIKNCKNEIIASIDSDVELSFNWLEILYNEIYHEDIAMCGGKMIEKILDSDVNKWRAKYYSQNWGDKKILNPPFLFGCNSIILKSKWQAAGGYNENLKTNAEDIDFSKKIKHLQRLNMIYLPNAICYHLQDDDIKSLSDRVWRYHSLAYKIKEPSLKKFLKISIKQIKFFIHRIFENLVNFNKANIKISFKILCNFIKCEFNTLKNRK